MRYPAEQKTETHERILDTAARSFREHGADGVNVAGLMQELGLTQGGFYRHFETKEELYASAVERGLQQVRDKLAGIAESAPKGKAVQAMIEYYLSSGHLQSVGSGCVIAALAPELSRQPLTTRKKISAAVMALVNRLAPFFAGETEAERRQQAFLSISSMAGVLMTARIMTGSQMQKEMLESARAFYVDAFTEKRRN